MPLVFPPGVFRLQRALRLELPPDLLPGRYRIEVLVRDSAGRWMEVDSKEGPDPQRQAVVLRSHEVYDPCDCLPDQARLVGVDLADGVRLLGYERSIDGDALDVVVYWQAREQPRGNYSLFIHLMNREGDLIAQFDGLPYDYELPTYKWSVGKVVPFAARLRLPAEGEPFQLRAGLYEYPSLDHLKTLGGRKYVSLGLLERREPPSGPVVGFEGGVKLLGHRFERKGDQGVLTLYWQTSRRVGDAYSVFVHVLDASGRIVAQGDGPP